VNKDGLSNLFLKELQPLLGDLFIFTALINLLLLVPTIYMLQIYDRVMTSYSIETLIMLSIIVFGLYILQVVLELFRSKMLIRASNSLDYKNSTYIFSSAIDGIKIMGPSYSVGQVLNDFTSLRQFFTGSGLLIFLDAPWAIIFLILMFLFHPLIGLLGVVGGVIILLLTILNEKLTKEKFQNANQQASLAMQVATSQAKNSEVIEAMGMLQNIVLRWKTHQNELIKLQTSGSDTYAIVSAVIKLTRLSMQSLVLGLGAYLAMKNEISGGMLIGGSLLMGKALSPIEQLVGNWKTFIQARSAWVRISKLLEKTASSEVKLKLPTPKGSIEVSQVSISPPRSKNIVVSQINFKLDPGCILGIIGPSGSGKSSLTKAIAGVWPCSEGNIRLDGAELVQYDRQELGKSIGYLPQEIDLFDGTVAENISRMAKPDDELVIEAAKKVAIHEMILQLPDGYQTAIGSVGMQLSGGQKQRLGLARAIYGKPSLIILDEPNSNLDEAGDNALEKTLLFLKSIGSTVIVVTHKRELLYKCDYLLVLANAKQVIFGNNSEVVAYLQRLRTTVPLK
jgi:PrtD family type I secretion system ABC transporter